MTVSSGEQCYTNTTIMPATLTLRLKVRTESYPWLNAAAREVNTVWNWCNATSIDAADRNRRAHTRFLSGFDLCNLSAGASEYFDHIGADTIQRVCCEYAVKRRAAQRVRLRWRVSRGRRPRWWAGSVRPSQRQYSYGEPPRFVPCAAARSYSVMVMIAGSVHVAVLELFLCCRPDIGDLDIEIQVLAGERMVAVESHHVAQDLCHRDRLWPVLRLRV